MAKRVFNPLICFCVITILLSLAAVPSAQAEGLQYLRDLPDTGGYLKFAPKSRLYVGLEVQEIWDYNIYNASKDEKQDYITSITPGMLLSLGDRHKLLAGYAYGIHSYSKHKDENHNDNIGIASIKLDFPFGLRIDVSDEYLDTRDARIEEDAERASHYTNDASAKVRFTFPAKKLSVELSCKEFYLNYHEEENEARNRKDDSYGAAIHYRFLPKSSALVEYNYKISDYFDSVMEPADADSTSQSVSAGLRWDATAKMSGKLTTGWERKMYSNSTVFGDLDLWTVYGNLLFKHTERTLINIDLDRSIRDVIYIGSVEQSPAAYYIRTGGGIGLEQKIISKFTLDVDVTYHNHTYSKLVSGLETREDTIMGTSAGIDFDFTKWVSTGIKYSSSYKDSNDNTRSELNIKGILTLSTTF
jgi:hypothetical protein